MSRPIRHRENHRFRSLLMCVAASIALLWFAARYAIHKPKPKPYVFPTAELAAIDRDLQARFAIVPDKAFGIERMYDNQHYLYNPQTPQELATIANLKQQHTQVAFYLMSRALWLRAWSGGGFKPIQGPVLLTHPIKGPLPRRVDFQPRSYTPGEILSQDTGYGGSGEAIETHTPDGTPVPSPVPPKGAPSFDRLQAIGNRVFEMAEYSSNTEAIGITEKLNSTWKVAAVPIRASSPQCLPCHKYQPMGVAKRKPPGRVEVELGDALGVAFYLFNTPRDSPKSLKKGAHG